MDASKPESFNHRTEKLSTGRTYHFVDQKPDGYDPAKNLTMVLVHGFPEIWYGWRHQIVAWTKAGYRVIVPDMLGYGGTDKPKDPSEYTTKKLSDDIAAILDLIEIPKAVIIGHDWGAFTVGRFTLWHPDRLLALITLSIPLTKPAPIHMTPEMIVQRIPDYGYQIYFASQQSTTEIEANMDRFLKLMYRPAKSGGPSITKLGELQPLVTGEKEFGETRSTVDKEEFEYFKSQMASMNGPLNYYRTGKLRYDEEEAAGLKFEVRPDLPVLFIRGTLDPTSPAGSAEKMREFIPQLKDIGVEAGHWLNVEAKDQVIQGVLSWLDEINLKAKL